MLRRSPWFRCVLALLALGLAFGARRWWKARPIFVAPLATAPIFADEFDGVALNPLTRSRLDPLSWKITGAEQILQRTQWGQAPTLLHDADGTTYARMALQTFNPRPQKAGRFHLSTQITSLDRWNLENGLEYETRLRADHLPPGLILGFFAYGDAGAWKNTYQKTEADLELLTHQGGQQIWTHVWDNWNPLRLGSNSGSLWPTGGANWNDGGWNEFKIRWHPDRTEWIFNGRLIRTEKGVRPGSPMGVWLNLWAPNPDWLDAYDSAVQAARTASQNQSYFYDVDYVRVRRIPAAPRDETPRDETPRDETLRHRASIGRGEGLQGNYFPNQNLTGRAIVRLDPRVDFDWGVFAPASGIGEDGFSIRWEGFIEARHSELYTLSVRSDDGARLWVDGHLLVDQWKVQGPNSHRGEIALRAGERVPVRLEMFNRKGNAVAQLWWGSASTPPEIVPQSQLYVASRPAAPRLSPGSRTLLQAQDVTIKSETPGATIHYTLDGTLPTRSSRKLPNGAKLRVKYTSLVRAGAFVDGQVPGETARAFYTLEDKTPPDLAITAPAPDARAASIAPVTGLVADSGSGVTRIDLVITRLSDGLRWKQSQWVAQEWGLGAKIQGARWSVSTGLPPQTALAVGKYQLKAVAYDLAGNVKGAWQNIVIEPSEPKMG